MLLPVLAALFSAAAPCQTNSFGPEALLPDAPEPATSMPSFDISSVPAGTFDDDAASAVTKQPEPQDGGLIKRSVRRTLKDQKEIYMAPFRPSNFRWDLPVLAGAAAFFCDRPPNRE